MQEVRTFCDHCGSQIHEGRVLLKLATGPERLRRPQVDLCEDHAREFFAWLDTTSAGDVQPTPRASMTNRKAEAPPSGRRTAVRTPSHLPTTP